MDFSGLNKQQLAPVQHIEGAVLVTAGAGSGKTRLLTYRIANILDKGIEPYNILCLTFTNKAAAEMRERIHTLVGNCDAMWIMTFHSMCARILREHIDKLGDYSRSFTIYADNDKERVIKRILTNLELDNDEFLKNSKFYISELKSSNLTVDNLCRKFDYVKNIEVYKQILNSYLRELRLSNALDFDDLLLLTYKLFEACPEVLEHYRDRFKYISVDEFQDTNHIQYMLVKLLAMNHKNLFVVGDEDQSIYGWRGANIENIFDFQRDFGAAVYKLEQNYRSTKKILAAANSVIRRNGKRLEKKLWTENCDGDEIKTYVARDEQDEADFCVKTINSLTYKGVKYKDIAVLLRVNALSRNFEEKFLLYNIPYRVFGGFKFYERKEIKDVLAYLAVLNNERDNESLFRIINFPKRGIGDAAVKQLSTLAEEKNMSVRQLLVSRDCLNLLPKSLAGKIAPFTALLNELIDISRVLPLNQIIKTVIELTGIKNLYSDGSEENTQRLLNLNELLNSAYEFENSYTDASLQAYLESVTLMSDVDTLADADNKVTIATIHSAKGLEFGAVFLAGMEETIFPISRADNSVSEIEEERRLMYVGITRAKERLFITRAASRFMYGVRKYMQESRFLSEMECFDRIEKVNFSDRHIGYERGYESRQYGNNYTNYSSDKYSGGKYDGYGRTPEAETRTVFSKTAESPKPAFDQRLLIAGTLVRHKTFGDGKIVSVTGSGDLAIASVNFLVAGLKKLALSYAPLEIIEK